MSARGKGFGADQVFGLCAIVIVAAAGLFAYAWYKGDISPGVRVTLRADRTGLLLEPGAKVTLLGVSVGHVRSVDVEGGRAVMKLDLDKDQARTIPANVRVRLAPTTLFGAKTVELQMPAAPVSAHLTAGDVIDDVSSSPETDEVFENLMKVLGGAQPQKINGALTAVSDGLRGRGEQLGRTITATDAYLQGILPSMPQLGRDLTLANRVIPTYEDAASNLVGALDNFRTTSATLVAKRAQLTSLLGTARTTGGQATALLVDAGPGLTGTVRQLDPVSSAVQRYAPMLSCWIEGTAYTTQHEFKARAPGLDGNAKFLGRIRPYEPGVDLPIVAEDSGPHCYGLPVLDKSQLPLPHVDFNVGRSPFKHGVEPWG